MDKRAEDQGRIAEGGAQDGPTGTGYRRGEGEPHLPAEEAGAGGQRREGGGSRDPAAQGRRTKEEADG